MSLPDRVPIVSFDVRLGGCTDYIDFDYEAFNELVETTALTPENVSELNVSIISESEPNLDAWARYYSRRNKIILFMGSMLHDYHTSDSMTLDTLTSNANLAFIHELGHHAEQTPVYRHYLGRLGIGVATALTGTIYSVLSHDVLLLPTVTGLALLAQANNFARHIKKQQHRDPTKIKHERFAYAFEASNKDRQIVAIEPKRSL